MKNVRKQPLGREWEMYVLSDKFLTCTQPWHSKQSFSFYSSNLWWEINFLFRKSYVVHWWKQSFLVSPSQNHENILMPSTWLAQIWNKGVQAANIQNNAQKKTAQKRKKKERTSFLMLQNSKDSVTAEQKDHTKTDVLGWPHKIRSKLCFPYL